jgi:hypothetical protein
VERGPLLAASVFALRRAAAAVAGLRAGSPYFVACSAWKVQAAAAMVHEPVPWSVPVLTASAQFDPFSPPALTRRFDRSLGTSFSIAVPDASHNRLRAAAARSGFATSGWSDSRPQPAQVACRERASSSHPVRASRPWLSEWARRDSAVSDEFRRLQNPRRGSKQGADASATNAGTGSCWSDVARAGVRSHHADHAMPGRGERPGQAALTTADAERELARRRHELEEVRTRERPSCVELTVDELNAVWEPLWSKAHASSFGVRLASRLAPAIGSPKRFRLLRPPWRRCRRPG